MTAREEAGEIARWARRQPGGFLDACSADLFGGEEPAKLCPVCEAIERVAAIAIGAALAARPAQRAGVTREHIARAACTAFGDPSLNGKAIWDVVADAILALTPPPSPEAPQDPDDPSRAIATMFGKLDEEDKDTFNFLVRQATLGQRYHDTLADPPACGKHNRELIYCGTCLANREETQRHSVEQTLDSLPSPEAATGAPWDERAARAAAHAPSLMAAGYVVGSPHLIGALERIDLLRAMLAAVLRSRDEAEAALAARREVGAPDAEAALTLMAEDAYRIGLGTEAKPFRCRLCDARWPNHHPACKVHRWLTLVVAPQAPATVVSRHGEIEITQEFPGGRPDVSTVEEVPAIRVATDALPDTPGPQQHDLGLRETILDWLAHRCDFGPPCGRCTYCSVARFVRALPSGVRITVPQAPEAAEEERELFADDVKTLDEFLRACGAQDGSVILGGFQRIVARARWPQGTEQGGQALKGVHADVPHVNGFSDQCLACGFSGPQGTERP